jgi:hypothetical protein
VDSTNSFSRSNGQFRFRFGDLALEPILIDAVARARLDADKAAYDEFIKREVDSLEAAYRQGAPPKLVALGAENVLTATASIQGRASTERARLRGLIGRMLVAAGGDVRAMQAAESHLVSAEEEFTAAATWTRGQIAAYVALVLNHAIALKARENVADSSALLRETIADRALSKYFAPGDTLPLVRQGIIMAGGASAHAWFADYAADLKGASPSEDYRSVKRVFEFVLNQGAVRAAEPLFQSLLETFGAIADHVAPLARISFIKNVGQFRALQGNTAQAAVILRAARRGAEKRHLRGQIRQIDAMLMLIDAGEQPVLNTFHAA